MIFKKLVYCFIIFILGVGAGYYWAFTAYGIGG